MNTSYYSRSSKLPNAISIAAKAPIWFTGKEYKKLAPSYDSLMRFKRDGNEKAYTEKYQCEVLDKLDARQVFEELGEDAILLCWEAKNKFCHRHLVSKWFKEKLEIDVTEI